MVCTIRVVVLLPVSAALNQVQGIQRVKNNPEAKLPVITGVLAGCERYITDCE